MAITGPYTPGQGRFYAIRTTRFRHRLVFFALVTTATAAAQNPFAGTWRINQEKSQLSGDTLKFGPAEGNAIQLTARGVSYSFRLDGANYATPSGNIAIWPADQPGQLDH